jgi:hypothetical protein
MQLRPGGIDIFYIDESGVHGTFVITSVRIPLLRYQDGHWVLVWQPDFDAAEQWRRVISASHSIKFRKELHAFELINCRGSCHVLEKFLAGGEFFEFSFVYLINELVRKRAVQLFARRL